MERIASQGAAVEPEHATSIARADAPHDAPAAPEDRLARLNADELAAFAHVTAAMLDARSAQQALHEALAGLGRYHRAHRTYVALVATEDKTLSIPAEWTQDGVAPISSRIVDAPLARFPFIKRNAAATKPVLVTRTRRIAAADPTAPGSDTWSFCIIPLASTPRSALLLCIDDPVAQVGEWALADALAPHIVHAWRTIAPRWVHDALPSGRRTSAPGRAALEHALSDAVAEPWGSCGALIAYVADVDELVRREGLSRAAEVAEAIPTILGSIAEALPPFQTDDTEYLALFPNVSYRNFIERAAAARMRLTGAYPGSIRIGTAWTGAASGIRGTVSEAQIVARHDNGELHAPAAAAPAHAASLERAVTPRLRAILDRFTIYFQPKIDARTGELAGAEALARYLDDDGTPISPVGRIAELEESQEINVLDYHIFNSALAHMSAWREQGYPRITVSSNFSRSTLLNPTARASVLALLSNYPAVSEDELEMEITERAFDLGTATLRELVESYRALGLHVALDDFGSEYANLAALANVSFDTIKLDRSIVSGLPNNPVAKRVVASIAEICSEQGIACVAEGVETSEQARAVAAAGCPVCQGFYYDKPLPPDLFAAKYLAGAA